MQRSIDLTKSIPSYQGLRMSASNFMYFMQRGGGRAERDVNQNCSVPNINCEIEN